MDGMGRMHVETIIASLRGQNLTAQITDELG
jgi:hypothetical protein